MAESNEWAFPAALQPRREQWPFDLDTALQSVVMVHSEVPEEAFTASILGTERVGSGVVIGADGLVVTIGYLITEASSIWLTTHSGAVIPGHALAYDQASGFGLVLPLGRLDAVALERGSTAALCVGDDVIVLGFGGLQHCLNAKIIAKREFAGHWEYVLDEALFTAPPHPQWGGTALVSTTGRLIGVGSLLVQEAVSGESFDANMFVPIDLLEPVLDEMITFGQPARPPRPWLGLYATELQGRLVVSAVTQGGPAYRAGVRAGDFVLEVAGHPIATLPDLFRSIWRVGPAGTEIPLTVVRGQATSQVRVRSADRNAYLMKPRQH
ncbi:MAG TPA: S1C family serine protease [Steroidobacteraceae bacterium]|jgi:S1-C subfamily serine protease|nr:S1C family serine protease [Steroidobacteraceae bacterium]